MFCCIYKKPYNLAAPWQCPTCGLLHAVRCEPEPAAPTSEAEMWLAEQLATIRAYRWTRHGRDWWRHELEWVAIADAEARADACPCCGLSPCAHATVHRSRGPSRPRRGRGR